MTSHSFRNAFIATAAASFLFAGAAQAEIVKCIDQSGHVTLTDMPCPADAMTAQSSAAPAPQLGYTTVSTHVIAPPSELRRDTWARKAGPDRSKTQDVATLKAARSTMLLMDQASSLMRQQRLAGAN